MVDPARRGNTPYFACKNSFMDFVAIIRIWIIPTIMTNTYKRGQHVIIRECHKHNHDNDIFPTENEGKRGIIVSIDERADVTYPNTVHIEGEEDYQYAPCELKPVLPDNVIDGRKSS